MPGEGHKAHWKPSIKQKKFFFSIDITGSLISKGNGTLYSLFFEEQSFRFVNDRKIKKNEKNIGFKIKNVQSRFLVLVCRFVNESMSLLYFDDRQRSIFIDDF